MDDVDQGKKHPKKTKVFYKNHRIHIDMDNTKQMILFLAHVLFPSVV